MHKIIIPSITVFVCLTGSAFAMSTYGFTLSHNITQNIIMQKTGWDQKNLDVQTQSTGKLIAKLKKLENENEQLRNSINLIRLGKTSYRNKIDDPRIVGLIDENKRLTAKIEQNNTCQASLNLYVQQINSLKVENKKLQQERQTTCSDDTTNASEIYALEKKLSNAQKENNKTKLSLKEITNKSLECSKNIEELNISYNNSLKTIVLLKQRLSKLKQENSDLSARLKLSSNNVSDKELGKLRQQNKSLRETIKAQSESLHSVDNAAKTAERLLSENTLLQNKLDMLKKSQSSNDKNITKMMSRIKTLEKDIARRDNFIKKMLTLKTSEFSETQDSMTTDSIEHLDSLREKNMALIKALNKEKKNSVLYRKKIIEYQKRLDRIKELKQASESGVHSASMFERHVEILEQKQQQTEKELSKLKLENQELQARLKLIQNDNKKHVSEANLHKSERTSSLKNNDGKGVITDDSSDNNILSVLDEDIKIYNEEAGKNNDDKVNGDDEINTEDLLQTDIMPLTKTHN